MLSGVLLHVVLAALHIDKTAHAERQKKQAGKVFDPGRVFDDVKNVAAGLILDDLGDAELGNCQWLGRDQWLLGFAGDEFNPSGVEGLTATGRIKRRAIQQQRVAAIEFAYRLYRRGEVVEKRVLIVKALGHTCKVDDTANPCLEEIVRWLKTFGRHSSLQRRRGRCGQEDTSNNRIESFHRLKFSQQCGVGAEELALAAALEARHSGALVPNTVGLVFGCFAISAFGEEFRVVELRLGEG